MKNETFKFKIALFIIIFIAAVLRLPYLDKYPPALYSDEVSQGYNAYSVLKTGRDEYGTLFPVSFRSFGDWKPPLQTYAMLPTIAIFGLNEWGIRLPSAILGIATVLLIYLLSLELIEVLKSTKADFLVRHKFHISLGSAFLLSISPWHIQQSRAAMLINVELFWFTFSVFSFLKGLKNKQWWFVSFFSAVLSIYSYYGMRLIVPLFFLYLFIRFKEKIVESKKIFIKSIALSFLLLIPLAIAFIRQPDVVFGRAKTVSIFHDQGVNLTVWDLIAQDGPNINSQLVQILHNKPYHYTVDILRRFFQHLDGRFLFLIGDQQPPFQIPGMGPVFLIDGIFVLIGFTVLVKLNDKLLKFLLVWIVISIFPAALTFVTPAANRIYTMIIPLLFISAVGIVWTVGKLNKPIFSLGIIFCYLLSLAYFIYNYTTILPKNYAQWWHFGYKQIYEYAKKEESKFKEIVISSRLSVPYIFLLFYEKVDPNVVPETIRRNYTPDEFGFEHVDSYEKYRFLRQYSWEKNGERLSNALLILTPQEKVGDSAREKQQIRTPAGNVIAKIYEIP